LRDKQRQALIRFSTADERLFAFSLELFTHANEHRDVFQAMVGKRSGAVIQQLLHKMLVDLVRDEMPTIVGANATTPPPIEAVAQFIGGGLFGLLVWWGSGRMRLPVAEVNAVFRRLAIPAISALRD